MKNFYYGVFATVAVIVFGKTMYKLGKFNGGKEKEEVLNFIIVDVEE